MAFRRRRGRVWASFGRTAADTCQGPTPHGAEKAAREKEGRVRRGKSGGGRDLTGSCFAGGAVPGQDSRVEDEEMAIFLEIHPVVLPHLQPSGSNVDGGDSFQKGGHGSFREHGPPGLVQNVPEDERPKERTLVFPGLGLKNDSHWGIGNGAHEFVQDGVLQQEIEVVAGGGKGGQVEQTAITVNVLQ